MPSVRGAAVTALGHIGGMKARALVLEVLREPGGADRQWSLRAAAMLALARCGAKEDIGEIHTIYREHSGDQHWFARSAYAHVVTALDPDPLPVLQKLVGDPDRRVQVTAAVGIARTGHDAEILRLLNHLVPSVRAAAASAVAQVEVTRAYPRLRVLARFDPSRAVRWAATLALFRLEDPTADPLVLQGVTAPEPAIWADALAALAARTGERHGRDVNAWRGALLRWRERQ
jgi:HEAT repeat protein